MNNKFDPQFLMRQMDIIPAIAQQEKITVIGAGAIGSHTVMSLVRMGYYNITVYDYDTVDKENMNNQGYYIKHLGKPKVECLAEMVNDAMGFTIEARNEMFKEQNFSGIVISAVDSMEVRKNIWNKCTDATWIIDPRMGAEFAKLFVMQRNAQADIDSYIKTLYSDDEAVREACTAKSTIYTASLISGITAKAVKDITLKHSYTRLVNWNIGKNAIDIYTKDFN